jgi:hypothetical protein
VPTYSAKSSDTQISNWVTSKELKFKLDKKGPLPELYKYEVHFIHQSYYYRASDKSSTHSQVLKERHTRDMDMDNPFTTQPPFLT